MNNADNMDRDRKQMNIKNTYTLSVRHYDNLINE